MSIPFYFDFTNPVTNSANAVNTLFTSLVANNSPAASKGNADAASDSYYIQRYHQLLHTGDKTVFALIRWLEKLITTIINKLSEACDLPEASTGLVKTLLQGNTITAAKLLELIKNRDKETYIIAASNNDIATVTAIEALHPDLNKSIPHLLLKAAVQAYIKSNESTALDHLLNSITASSNPFQSMEGFQSLLYYCLTETVSVDKSFSEQVLVKLIDKFKPKFSDKSGTLIHLLLRLYEKDESKQRDERFTTLLRTLKSREYEPGNDDLTSLSALFTTPSRSSLGVLIFDDEDDREPIIAADIADKAILALNSTFGLSYTNPHLASKST